MAVYRRDYRDEKDKPRRGESVWAYAFAHRKVRYRQTGFPTKRAAELAETKAREQVMVQGKTRSVFRLPFEEVAAEAIEHREQTRAPVTVQCERIRQKTCNEFFGKTLIDRIQPADILAFVQKRKRQGISNRTANLEINFLRVVEKHALQNGYLQTSFMEGIKNLPETVRDRTVFSAEEFQRLLAAASKRPDSEQLVTWLVLRGLSGVRPTEAVFAEWKDVDFAKGFIYVRPKEENPTKNRRFRAVPLHSDLRERLLRWKARWDAVQVPLGRPHDWVFFYSRDPTKRALGFRTAFEAAVSKAGMPHTKSYDFRHFFISQCLMDGCEISAVSRWVGASVATIMKYYAHLSPQFNRSEIEKLNFGRRAEKTA
jgi:integrase